MKDCKFKQLVIDSYKAWNNLENVTTGISAGIVVTKKNFIGIVNGAISSDGFNDILDIDGYMNMMNPNMLYLKSTLDDSECQVYDHEIVDYNINDDNILIQFINKKMVIKTKL